MVSMAVESSSSTVQRAPTTFGAPAARKASARLLTGAPCAATAVRQPVNITTRVEVRLLRAMSPREREPEPFADGASARYDFAGSFGTATACVARCRTGARPMAAATFSRVASSPVSRTAFP